MPIQIVEVMGRSSQGLTRPFHCKADDGNYYFVKGRGAGRYSQISEYLCGNLAKRFGLPVADFDIVEVPINLINWTDAETQLDLGAGLAFGSRILPHVQEFNVSLISKVDLRLRRDILVFDWWVKNADRTLTILGGNPNLLWDQSQNKLAVIDHNQAFDNNFDNLRFSQSHVFSAEIGSVFDDMVERMNYQDRLSDAFASFSVTCDNMPPEWWWIDDGVPANFSLEETKTLLAKHLDNQFWRIAE